MNAVAEIHSSITRAVEQVGPAVVGVGRGWRLGSGVVVADGTILTNAHNLRGDEVDVVTGDGRRLAGEVRGVDVEGDLAVVGADTAGLAAVAWEPTDGPPSLGTPVVALANPGGRGLRASFGFVSGLGAGPRGPRGRAVPGALEHTAPLPRGSSGGPLVDAELRLLGLNTARLEGGLILALPADEPMRRRVEELARGQEPTHRRLGVAVAPGRVARRLRRSVGLPDRDGLLVRDVASDGPGHAAGLEPGDLLVSAAGRPVTRVDDLVTALDELAGGARLELGVVRGADERTVSVAFDAVEAAGAGTA